MSAFRPVQLGMRFAMWAVQRRGDITAADIMARFQCARATAYRLLGDWEQCRSLTVLATRSIGRRRAATVEVPRPAETEARLVLNVERQLALAIWDTLEVLLRRWPADVPPADVPAWAERWNQALRELSLNEIKCGLPLVMRHRRRMPEPAEFIAAAEAWREGVAA